MKTSPGHDGSGLFVFDIAKGADALATIAKGGDALSTPTPLLPQGRPRYFRISTSVRMLWSHLESKPPSGSKENHAS